MATPKKPAGAALTDAWARCRDLQLQCTKALHEQGIRPPAARLTSPTSLRGYFSKLAQKESRWPCDDLKGVASVTADPAALFLLAGRPSDFATRLRTARMVAGYSQKRLGHHVAGLMAAEPGKRRKSVKNKSIVDSIAAYEGNHGRPCPPERIAFLADILRVPRTWLFGGPPLDPGVFLGYQPRFLVPYALALETCFGWFLEHRDQMEGEGVTIASSSDDALTAWLCSSIQASACVHPPAPEIVYWPWCLPIIRKICTEDRMWIGPLTFDNRRVILRALHDHPSEEVRMACAMLDQTAPSAYWEEMLSNDLWTRCCSVAGDPIPDPGDPTPPRTAAPPPTLPAVAPATGLACP